jgi:dihydrodipicolinate synthase/N-acetylneuraminate lyase
MTETVSDLIPMIKPGRKITGLSAMLLPFSQDGSVDWTSFEKHLERTFESGLVPAVNMDTGYVHLLNDETRLEVLSRTKQLANGQWFVAGAFVHDSPGDSFSIENYSQRMDEINGAGGTPVIFQSFGLIEQDSDAIVESYQQIAGKTDRFLGFELTKFLAPFGSVYDLKTYEGLLNIPQCIGAKHSSFKRAPEWERLRLRDKIRPDFKVFTGNDYGIDMVMYGSDYLLGLSSFAPDLFAKRDQYWQDEDPQFYELNDLLQYLGLFAFRPTGAAYKHSAAQFLKLRGWINSNLTHPDSPTRPEADIEVLKTLGQSLGVID